MIQQKALQVRAGIAFARAGCDGSSRRQRREAIGPFVDVLQQSGLFVVDEDAGIGVQRERRG